MNELNKATFDKLLTEISESHGGMSTVAIISRLKKVFNYVLEEKYGENHNTTLLDGTKLSITNIKDALYPKSDVKVPATLKRKINKYAYCFNELLGLDVNTSTNKLLYESDIQDIATVIRMVLSFDEAVELKKLFKPYVNTVIEGTATAKNHEGKYIVEFSKLMTDADYKEYEQFKLLQNPTIRGLCEKNDVPLYEQSKMLKNLKYYYVKQIKVELFGDTFMAHMYLSLTSKQLPVALFERITADVVNISGIQFPTSNKLPIKSLYRKPGEVCHVSTDMNLNACDLNRVRELLGGEKFKPQKPKKKANA